MRTSDHMRVVNVKLPGRSYPIIIGSGARGQLPDLVSSLEGHPKLAIVADKRVADLHLHAAIEGLQPAPAIMSFPAGEFSKSLEQAQQLYEQLGRARIARRDLILTFGGGVAGDLGGFVAATWMRGVNFVQMPTTIMAAIDASIGGKTGVNHAMGKNLIGAFHQPLAVVIDLDFLKTLPQRDYLAGLAESVKHGVIRDPAFFEWHVQNLDAIIRRDQEVLRELIARNCEIKAEVVALDEHEENLRMILNHGHTIGHALEHLLGYELRHGECVGLGMLVENELARNRGILAEDIARRTRQLLERMGLPVQLPRAIESSKIASTTHLDKKARSGAVRFVLLKELGTPEFVSDITDDEIIAALKRTLTE